MSYFNIFQYISYGYPMVSIYSIVLNYVMCKILAKNASMWASAVGFSGVPGLEDCPHCRSLQHKIIDYLLLPIGSMYTIYGNSYHQYTPNVSIYTIHGSYGLLLYDIYNYYYWIIYLVLLYPIAHMRTMVLEYAHQHLHQQDHPVL